MCSGHDELTETITDYIRFCEDRVITTKTIRVFPNNKPWLTKELKTDLVKKKQAFIAGNFSEVKEMNKEFKRKAKLAKIEFKDKVERRLKYGSVREAWKGLNRMMGRKNRQAPIKADNPGNFANELNKFYARFDVTSLETTAANNEI